MRNYFVNMVFPDIQKELVTLDTAEENADLQMLGHKMMLITCLIVVPDKVGELTKAEQITEEHLEKGKELILTEEFVTKFKDMCQMDNIPDISL